MNVETYREFCIKKSGVTESFPFDDVTLVFKVMGKMFALLNLEDKPSVLLKCKPERVIHLREQYNAVLPGYHMNKKHWIMVLFNEDVDDKLIEQWTDLSYNLVIEKLTIKAKNELKDIRANGSL